MTLSVLIVTPDDGLAQLASTGLEQADFDVARLADCGGALQDVHGNTKPDLVVIDLALPDTDGWELCRTLREDVTTTHIPIVMIAARGRGSDKIAALEAGADDSMTRPVQIEEFVARVKALARRVAPEPQHARVRAGPIDIDLDRWTVAVGGNPIRLTKKEFRLLQVLLEAKGRVLSRDALLERAWSHSSIHGLDTRTVDVHIGRLRRKLGTAGRNIITVRNVGFRFDVLPEWITRPDNKTTHAGLMSSRSGSGD